MHSPLFRASPFALLLALAACSSGPNSSADLGVNDLSSSLADLSAAPLTGCADLLDCLNACASQSCANTCNKQATSQARSLMQDLDDCLVDACEAVGDGGTARCDDPDAPDCDLCYENAQTESGACSPPADPACGACFSALEACGNDA